MFTLSYANGPGFFDHFEKNGRINPRGMAYMSNIFRQPTTIPLSQETHSAEDVGVYANGPQSHIFSGVYEQHYIAHAMIYATCLGSEKFEKHLDCYNSSNFFKLREIIQNT
jgi:alkaline phosphatase